MERTLTDGRLGKADALRLVLVYVSVSVVWLLVSEHLLAFIVADPDQRTHWGFLKGTLFVSVSGLLLYWLVRRLQERARAAERLGHVVETERLRAIQILRAMADSSNVAVLAKDLRGRYAFVNRTTASMLGMPVDDIVGRDDRGLFGAPRTDFLEDRGDAVIACGKEINSIETVERQDGPRTFNVVRGPLRDESGSVIGHYGFARDITSQMAVDAEAHRLAEDLAATLKAIPDLLFELDEAGRYVRVATPAHNLLAAPEAEMLGRTVHEMLPAEAARTVMEGIAAAALHGTDYGRTIALNLADGVRHFEMSFARKGTPGTEPARFIVLSRDITSRVEADIELTRSNEELRHFDEAAVERELRMIELKREINALSESLGRQPPYALDFAAGWTRGTH